MARLAISNKQINRLVHTFLWRRVTEQAKLTKPTWETFSAQVKPLLLLSNLFTFVKSGHPACPFITHKQLALYASPRFWQYGLLPSSQGAVPLTIDTDIRVQEQPKQWKGNHRKQRKKMSMPSPLCKLSSCPLLGESMASRRYPPMTSSMERQGFTPTQVKGSYGYRPKEEGAEDNSLLVVGVHTKAYSSGPLTRLWDKLSRFLPFLQRNSTTLPRYSKYYSRSTNEFRSFRKPKFQQQTQFEKRCSKKLLPFLSEGSSVRWAVQANKQTLYTRCLYSCLYISLHFILVSWLEPNTVAFQTLKETQVSSWALSKRHSYPRTEGLQNKRQARDGSRTPVRQPPFSMTV